MRRKAKRADPQRSLAAAAAARAAAVASAAATVAASAAAQVTTGAGRRAGVAAAVRRHVPSGGRRIGARQRGSTPLEPRPVTVCAQAATT